MKVSIHPALTERRAMPEARAYIAAHFTALTVTAGGESAPSIATADSEFSKVSTTTPKDTP